MIVQPHVAREGAFEVFAADEVVTSEYLFDAAVELLPHPVGLGSSRAGQPMLETCASHSRAPSCRPLSPRAKRPKSRSVNFLPLSVKIFLILIGQALYKALRKAAAERAVLLGLIWTNTQREARSMATKS